MNNLRREAIYVAAIIVAVFTMMVSLNVQAITGDEPRYMLYSKSFWQTLHLIMPQEQWKQESKELLGYYLDWSNVYLAHPVYLAVLLSPISSFGALGLRSSALVAGLVGLVFLYAAIRQIATTRAALVSIVVAALSFPVLGYLHTYWIEIFIFASLSGGLFCLQRGRNVWVRAIAILLIPFIHLRASVVGAALFAEFLLRVRSSVPPRTIMTLFAVAASFAFILAALNFHIYGSIKGSVTSAHPPYPRELYEVLGTNFVTIKGLLPYAPIWVLGYSGLLVASARRERFAIECTILALVALTTSIGENPGEGWPGRFLVTSIPLLSVGLAYWIDHCRGVLNKFIFGMLALLTGINTLIFILQPNLSLENRQSDRVFEFLFTKIGHLNSGLFIPVEGVNLVLPRVLLFLAIVLVALCALAISLRRCWPSVCAIVILSALLDLSRVSSTPASTADIGRGVVIVPAGHPTVASISFGRHWEPWFAPPTYPLIDVVATSKDGICQTKKVRANQVISIYCPGGLSSVELTSDEFDLAKKATDGVDVYATASILKSSLSALWERCLQWFPVRDSRGATIASN
ncbi:hypothetical protein [Bradyrhizobium sp. MOS002]|uniref:hypothetical protein n=1 Tax=Bradyrhizobium sp. MOS002 TaxID=2133947 RepID=UPI000D133C63|nr:hypothetical protein [Bradyrhizobium sp. MOS002]PSO16865.1 hypothetical protein C7G41_36230 [Bradyrhizobium sp. MOS002]